MRTSRRIEEGDKTSLRADRGPDGVMKVTMRGERVRRPRLSEVGDLGRESDAMSKAKTVDFDIDVKLGARAGSNGEACAASTPRCRA